MIIFKETGGTHMVLDVTGRLSREDYEKLVPRLEKAMEEHGHRRCLIALHDFEGWTMGGLWQELRFDLRHRKDFDRVAVVGESKLAEYATRLTAPFFGGQVRFFPQERAAEATQWLQVG